MKGCFWSTKICFLVAMSIAYCCLGEGKLLKRVKQQADIVSKAYGETWTTFYGEGYYKNMMIAVLDTRPDGTPNIVINEPAGKLTVTIRLSVNEERYNAWKDAAHKRFKDANMSFEFSAFEDPEGRMIGGKNYKFGENEEASIRRWEFGYGGPDAHKEASMKLHVLVKLISSDGRIVRQEYIPLAKFSRLGFASFPIPLHNLNRLKELPRSRFHWFHSDKEPAADSHIEDGYTKLTFVDMSKREMDELDGVKCELLDEKDMIPVRTKWNEEAKEREKEKLERAKAYEKAEQERKKALEEKIKANGGKLREEDIDVDI